MVFQLKRFVFFCLRYIGVANKPKSLIQELLDLKDDGSPMPSILKRVHRCDSCLLPLLESEVMEHVNRTGHFGITMLSLEDSLRYLERTGVGSDIPLNKLEFRCEDGRIFVLPNHELNFLIRSLGKVDCGDGDTVAIPMGRGNNLQFKRAR